MSSATWRGVDGVVLKKQSWKSMYKTKDGASYMDIHAGVRAEADIHVVPTTYAPSTV